MSVELANPAHPYWTAPRWRWLIAGTPTSWQYPCRCDPTRPCNRYCTCRGRTDLDGLIAGCCAKRAADTTRRNEPKEAA